MSSPLSGPPKAPKGYNSFQKYSPQQMSLFKQLFGNVGPDSYLSKLAGGDEETFNQIENPALKQFSGLQGQLASRFSGMGMGARNSSGFQNSANQASMDFASQLQSQRQSLQQQAIKDLMGYSNQLLNQEPYGLVQKPPKQEGGGWGGILGGALGGLGGYFMGDGLDGALEGAKFGYKVGSKF